MNEHEQGQEHGPVDNEGQTTPDDPGRSSRLLWAAAIVVLCLAAVAVGFIVDQHKIATQLTSRNQELTASLTQTKGQMQTLETELSSMKAQEAAQEQQEKAEAARRHRQEIYRARYRAHHRVVRKDDPRWKQVEKELAAHQKAIDSTQQNIQQTRNELQSSLSSTRNDLNGSIARTHAQLIELERRGERNYYEFDLFKTKRFQRVGPIAISLRKTNAKHQFCNLHLLVDDKELTKKHVNIYEPVVFYTQQNGPPLQLVINRISRHHTHGYLSTPKYPARQAASANSTPNSMVASAPATTPGTLQHRPGAAQ